ncbi:MAG: alpha-galactosidase [Bacteroidota bacterium]
MKSTFIFTLLFVLAIHPLYAQTNSISVISHWQDTIPAKDWVIHSGDFKAKVSQSANGKEVYLYNGLLKRKFVIVGSSLGCTDYKNLINGQQLLRAISSEAKVTINAVEYAVGGLIGQTEKAYLLPAWIDTLKPADTRFVFSSFLMEEIPQNLKWKTKGWTSNKKQPSGKMLSFIFKANATEIKGVEVKVHYELYDGIPLLIKWVEIQNNGTVQLQINKVVSELLSAVEEESAVVGANENVNNIDNNKTVKPAKGMKVPEGIYIETNYAFNNAMRYPLSDQTTHWEVDPNYTSQVNYDYRTPCQLEVYPEKVKSILLEPGTHFISLRTHELLMDSYDRERRGLAIRKMYQTIAPWTSANPIFMHLVSRNDEDVKSAIDQCVRTGYEAVILSFGSHINMEDISDTNLSRWKQHAEYAHSKGILLGGYSLFSSRRISDADDVISAKTGRPGGAFFGNAPCFGSKWGLSYRDKIKQFFTATGFDIWENDGPYPGDVCASTLHPGHSGLDDSQWKQMEIQKELYHWLNERGVYINAPDWYFLDGTNKIGIGYREVNFSLPRENQKILNRQNIYDGTWNMSPSMGWGFVPLTKYQGGGAEAILEPLKDHLKDYEQLMMQYYGAGVQACYRGPRLYDTEETERVVKNVIAWYKQYREILNSDIIHLRRADGRDWDGIMHLNPNLKNKGLLMLYNPLKENITRSIKLPLYYSGLSKEVTILEKGKNKITKTLDRNYQVLIECTIPAESYTWLLIQ